MAALVTIPDRVKVQAVILERHGLGWRVGIGSLVVGQIEREPMNFMRERDAIAAAQALADAHDVMAVRSK